MSDKNAAKPHRIMPGKLPPAPCSVCGRDVMSPSRLPTTHPRCNGKGSAQKRRDGPEGAAMPDPTSSPASLAVETTLPETVRQIYRELVVDYAWSCAKRLGRGYVSYKVLADLVLSGWRKGGA